jgi:hypothetical protein
MSEHVAEQAKRTSSRFDTILPALIGLLGVVVGGLVTAGFTALRDRDNRIGEERIAKRLIASEVFIDTQKLVFVSVYGRRVGPLPATVQWQAEGPTLARHVSESSWKKVSSFYANLYNIEHSLGLTCIASPNALAEITTIAKMGNSAYEALTHESVPSIGVVGKKRPCRSPNA